ncbi:MAG: putative N-acetylmannosamine-6-phosphate 2-epimerase [Candidatus Eremiobacteraeota bacterium]|nr:putative N-acetylmannosamine-6-phosphate 2-epimerase [Candidatus Eremiobacteraeota bacterium]MBC5822942.1 putative N-acetylmannosamine-6-phosphate 2-epimerase [Candidatus Eremiobacteraeota bacterium]
MAEPDLVLERLRGGLIVSVQAESGSVLGAPATIALLAQCAVRNGAVSVRIEGAANIAATAAAVDVPIIGIIKRRHLGFEPYITSTASEIDDVAQAGAAVVACDATLRGRPEGRDAAALIAYAHARGLLAMADCSEVGDADGAVAAGADIVATTLAGYTAATHGRPLPALDLVVSIAARHPFAVCEGGVGDPRRLAAAFAAGASAVVVGSAITNVDALVRGFAAAAPRARQTQP